jgi:hypothetical protein
MSKENPLWGCRFRNLDSRVLVVQPAKDRMGMMAPNRSIGRVQGVSFSSET